MPRLSKAVMTELVSSYLDMDMVERGVQAMGCVLTGGLAWNHSMFDRSRVPFKRL